jgi:hypothetical protein
MKNSPEKQKSLKKGQTDDAFEREEEGKGSAFDDKNGFDDKESRVSTKKGGSKTPGGAGSRNDENKALRTNPYDQPRNGEAALEKQESLGKKSTKSVKGDKSPSGKSQGAKTPGAKSSKLPDNQQFESVSPANGRASEYGGSIKKEPVEGMPNVGAAKGDESVKKAKSVKGQPVEQNPKVRPDKGEASQLGTQHGDPKEHHMTDNDIDDIKLADQPIGESDLDNGRGNGAKSNKSRGSPGAKSGKSGPSSPNGGAKQAPEESPSPDAKPDG